MAISDFPSRFLPTIVPVRENVVTLRGNIRTRERIPIIRIKRIYDPQGPDDGFRVLIDRLWPRGLSKARAKIDEWRREIAPSDDLRKWFQHDPEKFEEFRKRYRQELQDHMGSVEKLSERARKGDLTILYSAHDHQHNNAVVLKELLEEMANQGRRRAG